MYCKLVGIFLLLNNKQELIYQHEVDFWKTILINNDDNGSDSSYTERGTYIYVYHAIPRINSGSNQGACCEVESDRYSRLPFACGIMSGFFSKLSMLSALRGKVDDLSRGDEASVPDAARFAIPPSS